MRNVCDLDPELKDAIVQALDALAHIPRVGAVYSQQHANVQLAAQRRLQEALEKHNCAN